MLRTDQSFRLADGERDYEALEAKAPPCRTRHYNTCVARRNRWSLY